MNTARQENGASETRTTLHRLIDSLRAEDVATAQRILEALNATRDPLLTKLMAAAFDDEEETEEERAAVAEALDEDERIPHDEAMRRLGLE